MSHYIFIGLIFILSTSLGAFEKRPWMGDFLEFHFIPSFMYRHYPTVDRGYNPKHYSSNDRFTNLDLLVAFLPSWDLELDVEFADTRKQTLGTQSAGIQLRYQWLDDVGGGAVSLTTGVNVKWVLRRGLKDVSCPYHSRWNFELVNSLGKEWAPWQEGFLRVYGFLGLGQANIGRPWIRPVIAAELEYHRHEIRTFLEGYFGFGSHHHVNIDNFYGYARIFHQSIDLGALYFYKVSDVWGKFFIGYSYRIFAKAFPAHANTVVVGYNYPFSFF